MQSLVLEDYGHMVIRSAPDPELLPGTAIIAVTATGICGSDIHGYTGENGRRFPGQVMGHETVGRLVRLAPKAGGLGLRIGQTVTFNPLIACGNCPACAQGTEQHCPDRRVIGVDPTMSAAFAQQVSVPVANIVPLDSGMPEAHGALIEPLAVALHAVRRAAVAPGDAVFVAGGGPIGQSVVLASLHSGAAAVIVSEPDEARRQLCERLGAHVLSPQDEPPAKVRAILGRPADVGIDAVGVSPTLSDTVQATRPGAHIVLVGMGSPGIELEAYSISTAERMIIGSFCYTNQDFRDAAHWVGQGQDPFAELISQEVPLSAAPQAFAALGSGKAPAGKVLIRFPQPDLPTANSTIASEHSSRVPASNH